MKISLNKEYALRHLGVAALFTGLSLYFLYDAIFVYPYLPADGAHHTTVEFQYSAAAALAIFAFVVAFRVFLNWRATLAWDDEQMCGTLTCNAPLRFDDIDHLDSTKWEPKQILVVHAKDGRRVTLDAWHHVGARELAEKLLTR
ncbi:MAG: hypothetical protein IJL17_04270 [Kiritimatiellae bacterium]|nr:hypothetical protein [Kiritimatiellia bacterium]